VGSWTSAEALACRRAVISRSLSSARRITASASSARIVSRAILAASREAEGGVAAAPAATAELAAMLSSFSRCWFRV